jgi:hypothetical protein
MWIRACFVAEGKGKGWILFNNSGRHAVADPSLASTERLNPAALTPAEAARLLTAAGGRPITEDMVRAAVDSGAPVLADGRLNLVELAAWLEKELSEVWTRAGAARP